MNHFLTLLASVSIATTAQANIIIAESFGGDGTGNLNGTTADTFDAAITSAGGSNVWVARTNFITFADDGSVDGETTTSASSSAAFLNLGSYINDAKGTATGIFTFEATLAAPTQTNTFASFGLFNGDQVVDWQFATPDQDGLATAIIRSGELDAVAYFAGPGSSNTAGNSGNVAYTSSSVVFTTVLDLTSHDGISDFGTVSFYKNGSETADFTFDYTADYSFEQIGFSILNGADTNLSNFTLAQIPEPSTYALILGLLAATQMVNRRRCQ